MQFQIDPRVGVGLRHPHIHALLSSDVPLTWLEIHTENWLTDTGILAERLSDIRARYELSMHGVGMSLGSSDAPDQQHLAKVKRLVERSAPCLISEHLAWSSVDGQHANDLLPLVFDEATLAHLVRNIDIVQQALGRQILVENISSYGRFQASTMPEWEFVRAVVEQADCGLLLDINNVHVNAVNHGFDAHTYLQAMPWQRVAEIHLAGYEEWQHLLIDTHGRVVQPPVWDLFRTWLPQCPATARILIEWDQDVPALDVLLHEAHLASQIVCASRDAADVHQELRPQRYA